MTEVKPNLADDGIYRIIGGIYLSSYEPISNQVDIKQRYGISAILSVIKEDIPEFYTAAESGYTCQSIPINDEINANLLKHLHVSNEFLCKALYLDSTPAEIMAMTAEERRKKKHSGTVLIHCQAGVSRSASVLIAFLMKVYGMSYRVANYAVKRVKKDIEPNEGFVEQLSLFEEFGCQDDPQELAKSQKYKVIALADSITEDYDTDLLNDSSFYKSAESQQTQQQDKTQAQNNGKSFRCKKCRYNLCSPDSLIHHDPPQEDDKGEHEKYNKQLYFFKSSGIHRGTDDCTHYFVEPILWMKEELSKGELEGKLYCPKCEVKIGGYSWKGSRCSCGKWMIPALHLQKGKIDEIGALRLPRQV